MNENPAASCQRRARLRRAAVVVALAGTAVLAAACGGSHASGSGATQPPNLAKALDAYVTCMRKHGESSMYLSRVPATPNPSVQIMIFHGFAIQGADPGSPQFQTAQNACQHLLPMGTPPTAAELHQQFINSLKTARCMGVHGYPSWPDPKIVNGRVPNFIPSSLDLNSPQLQKAAKTCGAGPLGPP